VEALAVAPALALMVDGMGGELGPAASATAVPSTEQLIENTGPEPLLMLRAGVEMNVQVSLSLSE
jgi:hypothetical protein